MFEYICIRTGELGTVAIVVQDDVLALGFDATGELKDTLTCETKVIEVYNIYAKVVQADVLPALA